MNIAEQLNAGGFTGLTLYQTKSGEWQASVRRVGRDGWEIAIASTPEKAIHDVLADKIQSADQTKNRGHFLMSARTLYIGRVTTRRHRA